MGPIGIVTNTIGTILGGAAKGVGKAAWAGTKAVGNGILTGADKLAIGTVKAGKFGGKVALKAGEGGLDLAGKAVQGTLESLNSTNRGINVVGNALDMGVRFADKMGKYTYESYERNPVTGKLVRHSGGLKFTKLGAGILLGVGALAGARDAGSTYMDDRVGQIDPQRITATPDLAKEEYSAQIDNGGATGDLVFALHKNRHG